jgi:hypothetical protein
MEVVEPATTQSGIMVATNKTEIAKNTIIAMIHHK